MNTAAFPVSFPYREGIETADIHPCCREDNIVDYAVWHKDQLAFTITRHADDKAHWVVALRNADDEVDEAMVQAIGAEIDKRSR